MNRKVLEIDFRKPEFREAKVEDYEFRDDGALVRKDRWETAVRQMASLVEIGRDWEIIDIKNKVKELVKESVYPECSICGFEFDEETMDKCYHFSGVINGKKNTHIHVCEHCLHKYDFNAEFSFDERVSEVDGIPMSNASSS